MSCLIHLGRSARAVVLATVLVTTAGASAAWARDLRVANATSPADCAKPPHYTTVQAAVTAANPGDHIKLCPGTYTEQVNVPAGKDDISLEGNGNASDPNQPAKDYTAIAAPAVMAPPQMIVRVVAHGVRISALTITGPGGPSTCVLAGVQVDLGGSARLEQDHVTRINNPSCDQGDGVLAGGDTSPGTVVLKNSTVDAYHEDGVSIYNQGSMGDIENNLILGPGVSHDTRPVGVEVEFQATAAKVPGFSGGVTDNVIAGNQTPTGAGFGVRLRRAGATDVRNNVLQFRQGRSAPTAVNDTGIADDLPGGTTSIFGNTIQGQNGPGIDVGGDAGNTTLENNQLMNNAGDGIWMESSTSNDVLRGNHAKGNGQFDCHDQSAGSGTAGTANLWMNDMGVTQQPSGICKA